MSVLEVKNITKSFGKTEVLKGISFSLEKGEVLAIIGSSGSGKTTLLRCLNFLETPSGGSFYVNGELVYDASAQKAPSEAQIRKNGLHFGLVFQSFNLFPQYTVFRNVTLAPELKAAETYRKGTADYRAEIERIHATAHSLIARVGLTDKENSYPCQLSGGQQQRVAIARALARQPEILCFDEPTSALDPELTGEVLRVIKGLKSGDSTMIVVTHEMEFARSVADRVIFMADGVIEEEGTPEEVFGNPQSPKTQAFLAKSLEKI
ncbi:MAG: amino acid ABC transporter ATP-binding protein [Clostridia bacterium]|nr:amino acid ABC transporter ATP-binding protein [Clostridia bacterium]